MAKANLKGNTENRKKKRTKAIKKQGNLSVFKKIIDEVNKKQEKKDIIEAKSRIILTLSKTAIYSVHRNELKKAKELLSKAKLQIQQIIKANKKSKLESNIYSASIQEFVEAFAFYVFITEKRLIRKKEIEDYIHSDINTEDYILALSDLTGELGRKAVLLAIDKKTEEIAKIRNLVDDIYGLFLQLNLKNGELRRKSDAIKWNLKKIEELLYDLKKSR